MGDQLSGIEIMPNVHEQVQSALNDIVPNVHEQVQNALSAFNVEDFDLYDDKVPDCICGAKMNSVIGNSAYGGCNKKCWNGMVYHCPNEKDSVHHQNGYDLCQKCGNDKFEADMERERLQMEQERMEQAQVEQEEVPVSDASVSEAPLSVSPVLVQMDEVQDQ